MSASPFDPETEYELEASHTSIHEDGYAEGEPKWLRCVKCGAEVKLTEEPTHGVDELPHKRHCPQRFVRSDWWVEQFGEASD